MPTNNSQDHKQATVAAFIDANVLLGFYAYSTDDLKQLEKVKSLIDRGALVLYEPVQVSTELKRNRENKIAEALENFQKDRLSAKLPVFMQDLKSAKEFNAACSQATSLRSSLVKEAKELSSENKLQADRVLNEIMASSQRIECSEDLMVRAVFRQRAGNPPGKGSMRMGDEINWEALLEGCPKDTDLHIISKDGDFASKLDGTKPKEFLAAEWREKNGGALYLHAEFAPFLATIDKAIQLASEARKDVLVARLVDSRSFRSTHLLIDELNQVFDLLSNVDAERLLSAALSNPQIRSIAGDADVHAFFRSLIDKFFFETISTDVLLDADTLFAEE